MGRKPIWTNPEQLYAAYKAGIKSKKDLYAAYSGNLKKGYLERSKLLYEVLSRIRREEAIEAARKRAVEAQEAIERVFTVEQEATEHLAEIANKQTDQTEGNNIPV